MKKTIYLMHNSTEQSDLWGQYLPGKDIELLNISPDSDMVNLLEKTPNNDLPSLILVEMSIKSPINKHLQSINVCRWCKENQPSIKIILLTVRPESEVTKVEQRWASRQGAICLLPKLDLQNAVTQIGQIYEYLDVELPTIKIIEPIPEVSSVDASQIALGQARFFVNKKDFVAAMNQLKEAIKNDRENVAAYLLCGEIYTELKNLDKAIQAYSQAISIDPKHSSSYYKRGLIYNSLKNYHAAIADFNELIQLETSHAEAYNARGLARKLVGDTEGAKFDYNYAIAINPDYAEAYLNRGMLQYTMGEQIKARQDYEQAVRLDPQYEGSYFAWANNSEIKGLSVF